MLRMMTIVLLGAALAENRRGRGDDGAGGAT